VEEQQVRVVLLSRRGCHLCDEARAVVTRVCADLGVAWREDEISEHPELLRRHTDDVPVTFVDGEVHDFWRVDEQRLRTALAS
jgi:glutaredoxin